MAQVVFYEKPGCINNRKQKRLLERAGHELNVRNLLQENWSGAELKAYLDNRGPEFWVNRSHPDVKAQRLSMPQDENLLIDMLCADPLLIRRPLISADGLYFQGFEPDQLRELLDPDAVQENLEDCPRTSAHSGCSSAEA